MKLRIAMVKIHSEYVTEDYFSSGYAKSHLPCPSGMHVYFQEGRTPITIATMQTRPQTNDEP